MSDTTASKTARDPAQMLDVMRRGVAGGFSGCRDGDACPHPTMATCACLETAVHALQGLLAALGSAPGRGQAVPADLSGAISAVAARLRDPALREALAAQVAAHGGAPLSTREPPAPWPRRTVATNAAA